jgi:DNA-directed RNA polymerase II subunit RPB2
VQIGSPGEPVKDFLEEWTTEPLEEIACSIIPTSTKVFLNGVWIGIHRNPMELVKTLRSLRRQVRTGLLVCTITIASVKCC